MHEYSPFLNLSTFCQGLKCKNFTNKFENKPKNQAHKLTLITMLHSGSLRFAVVGANDCVSFKTRQNVNFWFNDSKTQKRGLFQKQNDQIHKQTQHRIKFNLFLIQKL